MSKGENESSSENVVCGEGWGSFYRWRMMGGENPKGGLESMASGHYLALVLVEF